MKKLILILFLVTFVTLNLHATQIAETFQKAKRILEQSKKQKDSVFVIKKNGSFNSTDMMLVITDTTLITKNGNQINSESHFGYGRQNVKSNFINFLVFSIGISIMLYFFCYSDRKDELSAFPAVYMLIVSIINILSLGIFYFHNGFLMISQDILILNILILFISLIFFTFSDKPKPSSFLKTFQISIALQFITLFFCFF